MRFLVIAGGWLVAVALAVLVGVVGINLVGSGLTDPQAVPLTEKQVERELALSSAQPASAQPASAQPASSAPASSALPASSAPASSALPAPAASISSAPASWAPPAGKSFPTEGGIVVADCTRILSMAPAQGWAVADQDDDEGEFRSVDDPSVGIEVDLACTGGQPAITLSPAD